MTAKQRMIKILDQPEEGRDGYMERRVNESGKRHEKCRQPVHINL